jgi:hypothetical protein
MLRGASSAASTRVTLNSPPTPSDAPPTVVVLDAEPLPVRVEEAVDPELIQCARDPGRNLLAGAKFTARGSTTLNGDWVPDRAFDNLQIRGWAAASDDPIPTLTLELEKPVRATTLVLTPARIGESWQSRMTKLAITFNNKLPPLLVDVPVTAEQRKLRLRLRAPVVVRKLEVKVLDKIESPNNDKAVGFMEVELQADEAGGS